MGLRCQDWIIWTVFSSKSPAWMLDQLTDLVSRSYANVTKAVAMPLPWLAVNGVCYECAMNVWVYVLWMSYWYLCCIPSAIYGLWKEQWCLPIRVPLAIPCCCTQAASIDPVSVMLICSCLLLSSKTLTKSFLLRLFSLRTAYTHKFYPSSLASRPRG